MPHLKLSFEISARECASVESMLFDSGAESVAYFDAAGAPIHEPAPSEAPLWPEVRVEALYCAKTDPLLVEVVLRTRLQTSAALHFTHLEDRVWEREWLRDLTCMRFGDRLWVCPEGRSPGQADAVVIDLDPGLAFGTGTHPTTALCLEWLDANTPAGRHIVDFGCGSGILAIAALRLGAARVLAIDIDPQARSATLDNAIRNHVDDRLAIGAAELELGRNWDVVIANILAGPLVDLAPQFAAALKKGGTIVLSGILVQQIESVRQAYAPWFDIDVSAVREDWACLVGHGRSSAADRPGRGRC